MSSATRLMAILLLPLGLALSGCGGSSAETADPVGGSPTPPSQDDTTQPDDSSSDTTPDDTTEPSPGDSDKSSPQVVKTSPEDRSDGFTTTGDVVVSFDSSIDPASVTTGAVSLVGPAGGIAFDIRVENQDIILVPVTNLLGGVAYTVTVDGSIRDIDGNLMGDDYSWQFTTAWSLCSNFYTSTFSLKLGKDTTPKSTLPRPAKGVPYTDPAYKSCVVRIADHESEGLPRQSRNYYSRIQPFNADDSRVLVHSPAGEFHLYDVHNTKYVKELPLGGGSVEPQWHPENPDILYFLPNQGGMTINSFNVVTDEKKVVTDFRRVKSVHGRAGATSILDVWSNAARLWTHWEGSPSRDARYWAFMVENSSGFGLGMITYDLQENVITGVFDYAKDGGGVGAPDHISMSPSGDYVVPSWAGVDVCASRSSLGTAGNPCGMMAYTRDLKSAIGLTDRSPHSDIGIDANGRDVIVASDYSSGWVEMWDLATGQATRLFYIYENGNSTAMHISAKNYDKPGWVLVSTYKEKASGWYAKKLFALEMKANPRILNIAHSYNIVETYYSETHAAVNRDFTRISFNSNWDTGDMYNIDAYMVVLPKNAVPYQ
ncbi:MAG: Ig-like domain-containing protein [Proteobacteria bacterium]|nr:Ig-like domain-containing protein [Pseudomonadota bacterium]